MRWRKQYGVYLVAFGFLFEQADGAIAQRRSNPTAVDASTLAVAGEKHAFDFELGTWKAHTWQRQKSLAGSSTWDQFDGIEVVRSVGNGAADLLEFHADGPAGHLEGLWLRFYEPLTQQWTCYCSNDAVGAVLIPSIGVFQNGQGVFYDQEIYAGKAIVVRSVWSGVTPDARYFERASSEDGGRTWEVNWITTYVRSQGK